MRTVVAVAIAGLALFLLLRARRQAPAEFRLSPPDAARPRRDSAARGPARRTSALETKEGLTATAPIPALKAANSAPRSPIIDETVEKERILDEIFLSRDDNDPRLDWAFNALSVETRRAFRRKYRELPRENLNQRGTILYLLGKNLRTTEDWAFLREAAAEPPCLSLSDCSRPPDAERNGEDAGDAVTLAYPALVAIKQAEPALLGRDAQTRREAAAVLRAALGSQAAIVAEKAGELLRRAGISSSRD